MIPHDTKGVNLPPEPTAGLAQTLLERRGGPFAHEQVFAVITPVNDVITPARKFDSHLSWHPVRAFRNGYWMQLRGLPQIAVDAPARFHGSRHDPVPTAPFDRQFEWADAVVDRTHERRGESDG